MPWMPGQVISTVLSPSSDHSRDLFQGLASREPVPFVVSLLKALVITGGSSGAPGPAWIGGMDAQW